MMGLLNLGSFVLGLVAWILPVVSLMQYKQSDNKRWVILSMVSISACAVSLSFQLYYNYHLVQIEDWSALMDTMWAVVFAATVLLIVTMILNALNFIMYRKKTVK